MSYILDALKKSDQQRRRGAAPTLLAPQSAPAVPVMRLSMLHVSLVVMLIGAGIVIGTLRPWQSEPRPASMVPATVDQAVAPSVEVALPLPAPMQAQPPAQSGLALPAQAYAPVIPPAPAVPEQPVMTMAELPLSIQQEIPKMTITVHAYSHVSKERLLGINDQMLKEGDDLMPGLLLEQITPDGMIMNYRGYRFRRGVR